MLFGYHIVTVSQASSIGLISSHKEQKHRWMTVVLDRSFTRSPGPRPKHFTLHQCKPFQGGLGFCCKEEPACEIQSHGQWFRNHSSRRSSCLWEQVWVAEGAGGNAGSQYPGTGSSGMLGHVNTEELTLSPWVSAQTVTWPPPTNPHPHPHLPGAVGNWFLTREVANRPTPAGKGTQGLGEGAFWN